MGIPGTVQVMQGLGLGLDEKAVEAARQSEYTGDHSGREVEVQFRLDRPAPWDVASEAYTVTVPNTPRPRDVVEPVPMRYLAPDSGACQSTATAIIVLLIGTDGKPHEVIAIRGDGGAIAVAAVKAVEGWQFKPATVDGEPAEAQGEVELECQPAGMILKSERTRQNVFQRRRRCQRPGSAFQDRASLLQRRPASQVGGECKALRADLSGRKGGQHPRGRSARTGFERESHGSC